MTPPIMNPSIARYNKRAHEEDDGNNYKQGKNPQGQTVTTSNPDKFKAQLNGPFYTIHRVDDPE